ncbi:MAG: ABC transporter ATP-binding protein [Bacteroidia bacterium]|nr:MAG: ABC transporter ATP-binding protein [Bacteroidia bacterium]PIE86529.1 MAG: ABC transporter ATP-binding protein [Bacteroidia bacterium]
MIELKNVNKSFGDKHVLKNISLTFEPGKVNLIIGQSGSGKTVLLKSTIGLFEIDNGQILYNNREFSTMSAKQKKEIHKEIGMVFQGGALFDFLTVEENVRFPLDMFTNLSHAEKTEQANFCIKRVNLQKANHLFPSEISGGMQKRVAIARAIALNPKYLFCDEPNSGLDPRTSIVIDKLISEITQEYNITTVINTHDMNSVIEIGDNIFFVYKGEKWWQGHKAEMFNTGNKEVDDFVFASKLMKKIQKK